MSHPLSSSQRLSPRAVAMRLTVLLMVAHAAAFALGSLSPATAQAWQENEIDGVLHVRNGQEPSQGCETLRLAEQWRAGGEGDDVFFGVINQVRTDEAGNIYLLDAQLSEVTVYAPDGRHLHTLSREGEGPGESRNPAGLLMLPSGELGLIQTFPGRVVKIDRTGNPAGSFTVTSDPDGQGGFSLLRDGRCGKDNMVIAGVDMAQTDRAGVQKRTAYLGSFTEDGALKAMYLQEDAIYDFTNYVFDEEKHMEWGMRRFAVDRAGRVYAATVRDQYLITVYNPDGTVNRVIEREFDIQKRMEDERREWRELIDASLSRFLQQYEIDIKDTEPPIGIFQVSVNIAPDGNLWILSSRGVRDQDEGVMQTYDVFDPEGHFIKQVSIACEGDGREDSLFFAGRDRFVLVKGFVSAVKSFVGGAGAAGGEEEPEPMEVICYAVQS